MTARKIPADGRTQQPVHPFQERSRQDIAILLKNRQKMRIAPQIVPELIKRPEPLLCLANKDIVRLIDGKHHGIVYMRYADPGALKLAPEEDILITIAHEPLVERMRQGHLPPHKEVRRTEASIWVPPSSFHRMLVRQGAFVKKTDITPQNVFVAVHPNTAIDNVCQQALKICGKKTPVGQEHVAVHQQDPLEPCRPHQTVTDGGAPPVLLKPHKPATGHSADKPVFGYHIPVSRTIVAHNYLKRNAQALRLPQKTSDKLHTHTVIRGHQNGKAQ